MAEPISIQQLKDASLDVKSLEEVVNGDENFVVTTRLGETYPSVKGSIKKVFETGGLPAEPFATKSLMTASALVNGDYAMVTDDTVNNGLYVKAAGAWVKSEYDPLTQAKSYADANPMFLPVRIQATDNLNDFVINGEYHKIGSHDIDAVTNNYPVPYAGVLRVSGAGGSIRQFYMPFVSTDVYTRGRATGEWVKSAFTQAEIQSEILATLNSNPMVVPIRIQATDNLDDFLTNGEYHKIGSHDIDATANNYPVPFAGVLRVSGERYGRLQTYTTFTNPVTYMRSTTSTSFSSPWRQVSLSELPKLDRYYAPIEWQGGTTTKVSFDTETKKVTMKGLLVAAYNISGRSLRISGLDITLSGRYDVCYLDLIALGSVTVIDASNYTDYIKVGMYEDGSYLPEVGKVPLFKYDALQGKAVPCSGFVPIYTTGSDEVPSDSLSPCYYQYAADSLKVYSQVKENLYVGFNVRYQFYDDDIIYQKYWRIANADFYTLTDGLMVETGKKALAVGESEFVIKQSEAKKDFTGGYHGDEQMTDVLFLADGVPVSITGTVPLTACSNFEYIIKSTMHETTETTGGFIEGHPVIADHIKHTSFLNGGYKTYNKIIFNYTGTVQTVYHGLSCISKDVVNKVMIDKDFTLVDMTGSGSEIFREVGNYRKYIGFNTANNLSAQASARIINDDSSDVLSRLWVSDRVGDSKYYRRSPVDLPVSVGDVFESEFECYFNSK